MKKLTLIITLMVLAFLSPVAALAQPPVVCEFEYTVQAGDWLSRVAEKYYGDVLAYPAIAIVNNANPTDAYTEIVDPNVIEPGWTLCIPSGEDMVALMNEGAGSAPTAPAGLSPAELSNATYTVEYTQNGTAPLTNGQYSEAAAPGSATMTTVSLTDNIAYGQLNGQDAAAVILVSDPGGSGTFYDLAVVVSQNGQSVNVATTFLGDRIQINALSIANNQIEVDLTQAGPDDPLCCPSQQVIKTFELQGEQLVEISSEDVTAAAPELVGPAWSWEQTQMNSGDLLRPDNPANYTLQFMADGSVTIQADCNQVSGTYNTDGSSLTISPGPSTLAACPEGSLGDQFVANLSAAAIYFFQEGQLHLDLLADGGTMRFSPLSSDLAGAIWSVTGYNNGRGGVVSPLIGTELTATFDADGTVTGSAGCNNYSVSYQIEGETITFGPPLGTLQECAEPEGVMVQEMEFLTALSSAATYNFKGEELLLRAADNSLAVTLIKTP